MHALSSLDLLTIRVNVHSRNRSPKNVSKSDALSKCKLVKFREVSDSVWVSFEAVIIEKTIKEK